MPKRTDIRTILIIGSGPIVIGQGCEFDYSGAQACKTLRAEGYTVFEARNGREALDYLAQHQGTLDLVVSDVVMPAMTTGSGACSGCISTFRVMRHHPDQENKTAAVGSCTTRRIQFTEPLVRRIFPRPRSAASAMRSGPRRRDPETPGW